MQHDAQTRSVHPDSSVQVNCWVSIVQKKIGGLAFHVFENLLGENHFGEIDFVLECGEEEGGGAGAHSPRFKCDPVLMPCINKLATSSFMYSVLCK